jgi:CBS domain containing-hemolysin-like protein
MDDPLLKLALTLFLVAVNGFFVAAEFAFVRVRQTRIAELASDGNAGAEIVRTLMRRLDTYLSATQLGVTLASLAIGAIGEPTVARLLSHLFRAIGITAHKETLDVVALTLGFLLITIFHIVFGELLPKWWVIAHTERSALGVARPMRLFLLLGFPLIKVLEGMAKLIAHRLHIEPGDAHEQAHSEDEIEAIISHSHAQGELRPSEVEIVGRVFDFAHTQAREIMVPRVDIVYLSTNWTIGKNVEVAVENGFTRYPLAEGDRDHLIGMIHIKDLLAIAGDPEADISSVRREVPYVPENKMIDELLKELQKSHAHQAVVLDEYGGTAGLVTLEDILEELVGEIQDEHDEPPPLLPLDEEGRSYSVAGTVSLEDVAEILNVPFDNPEDYDTIGGYALHQMHLPPRQGASAHLDGFDVSVAEATGRRIRRLLFTRQDTPPVEPAAP